MKTARAPQCSSCDADVIWALAPGGWVMLDKARDSTGTSLYAVMRDVVLTLRVRVLSDGEQLIPGAEHRHQRHDDTCTARRRLNGDG